MVVAGRLADRLGVFAVALAAFDVRFDVLGRDQAHPMVRPNSLTKFTQDAKSLSSKAALQIFVLSVFICVHLCSSVVPFFLEPGCIDTEEIKTQMNTDSVHATP